MYGHDRMMRSYGLAGAYLNKYKDTSLRFQKPP